MNKKSLSVLGFIISFVLGASAQDTMNISLNDAVAYGIINANKIKIAKLNQDDASKQVKETMAIGLPQINGSANFNDNVVIPTQIIPNFTGTSPEFIEAQFGVKYNAGLALNVNQIIFDGSYIVGLQASKALVALAEYQKNESTFEVEQAVKQAYYSVLVGEKNIELLDSNYANTKRLAYEIQKTFEAGLAEETDADQIQLNLKRIENLINSSVIQLQFSKNLLKFEMGIPFEMELVLTDNLVSMMQDPSLTNAVIKDFNIQENNLFKLSEQNTRMQELNIKYEKSTSVPTLNAFLSQQYNGFGAKFNDLGRFNETWYPSTVWGVTLNVPIFSSLMRYQKVQRAKIGFEKAVIEQNDTERSLKLQLNQIETEYYVALNTFYVSLDNKSLADKIYKKTKVKFQSGMASSLEYSQVERQQVEAQQELMQSVYNVLVAKTKLDKIYNK